MDPRIERHAEILVDYSIEAEAGDEVVVSAAPEAEDLVVAIAEKLGERGANLTTKLSSSRAGRAHMNAKDEEDITENAVERAMTETTDAFVYIRSNRNSYEFSDVPPEKMTATQRANKETSEIRMGKRWVLTQFPTEADAQNAEMPTDVYEGFVWNAINRDWQEQYDHQAQFTEMLDEASEVHIVSGDTTDIRMNVEGMRAANDHGKHNMPAGEVFTAPNPESVEGEVLFDMPLVTRGREVTNVRLVFEGGEVVEHSADKNEDLLTAMLDTDEGARRLGELGIGMNRGIDRFTKNMLFDEKMGDTVHMAIGRAIDENVPEGKEANDSAVHTDMIVDMSEDSYIELDGEVVQRDGTFKFEDGFGA
ncbi:Leucyl aminopeptidase (aminopeptidase T) [Halogranum gelatinilyticum]|uniref:Leucyl aminopeptidase (Aminopeptidase T) n=1 Tax=Halogranum gelatinilyticum TaxID=660521 RepID=A0A1G9VHI2_9EURY|nr:aminopeptidase [Halogranum gelatinilyticum]SDM71682.1 Leucyl aminopeptidase (aminopeptidase T) [Halogranum gelatinilyticum]